MADVNQEKLDMIRDALSGEAEESGRNQMGEAIWSIIIYVLMLTGIVLAGNFIPVIGVPFFISIGANIGFVAIAAQIINIKKGK